MKRSLEQANALKQVNAAKPTPNLTVEVPTNSQNAFANKILLHAMEGLNEASKQERVPKSLYHTPLPAPRPKKRKQRLFTIDAFRKQCLQQKKGIATDVRGDELELIGNGSFGDVFKYGNNIVKLCKEKAEDAVKYLLRESKMVEIEAHENIIRTISCVEMDLGGRRRFGLVMERADIDLFDHFEATKPLDDATLGDYVSQLLTGVVFLHDNGISHNDLKLENVLVVKHSNLPDVTLKLCDFGFAHSDEWTLDDGTPFGSLVPRSDGRYEYFGTAAFLPSEKDLCGRLAHLRDEWALGCIIYILSYNHMLYNHYDDVQHVIFQVGPDKPFKYYAHIWEMEPRFTEEIIHSFMRKSNPMTAKMVQEKFFTAV